MSTVGGYHEYCRGISWVLWVSYIQYLGEISWYMWGNIMSTVGDKSFILAPPRYSWYPHVHHDIPLRYWVSPTVLMISPRYWTPPRYWAPPPRYWTHFIQGGPARYNRFLCPLVLFLKSETHELNLKDVIELNRNLWWLIEIKLLLTSMKARQYSQCYRVLAQKTFDLFTLYLIGVLKNSQQTVTIIEILKEFQRIEITMPWGGRMNRFIICNKPPPPPPEIWSSLSTPHIWLPHLNNRHLHETSLFDSRIVWRTVCESMPSRVQKLLQWVVALENQHAIRAVCKGTPTKTYWLNITVQTNCLQQLKYPHTLVLSR